MAARANSWLLGNARGATVHQGEHHSAPGRMKVHNGEHHFTPGRTPLYTRLKLTTCRTPRHFTKQHFKLMCKKQCTKKQWQGNAHQVCRKLDFNSSARAYGLWLSVHSMIVTVHKGCIT